MIKLYYLPLDNIEVTSPYGKRNIRVNNKYYWWHNGVDLKANINTPVYAIASGKVMAAAHSNSYGYYLAIDHGNYASLYGHLASFKLKNGDLAKAGAIIGYSGNTGDVTGPHLHFEIRLGKYENFWDRAYCDSNVFMNTVDPMLFIDKFIQRNKKLSLEESINLVKSAAGLEERTMEYIASHYKFGEDLVKKLARAINL